jgi:hypothetical protein
MGDVASGWISEPEAVKSVGWAIRTLLDVLDKHRRS